MALQVCEYPKCKAITFMSLCEHHRHEDFDDEESVQSQPETVDELHKRVPAMRERQEMKPKASAVVPARKEPSVSVPVIAHVRRPHTLSASARAKISEALRRRHAKAGHKMTLQEEPVPPTERCTEKWCRQPAVAHGRCERHLLPGEKTAVTQLPAKRASAPLVLVEATQINPPPSVTGNLHGTHVALPAVYELITEYEDDLAALRRTKEILERHA